MCAAHRDLELRMALGTPPVCGPEAPVSAGVHLEGTWRPQRASPGAVAGTLICNSESPFL